MAHCKKVGTQFGDEGYEIIFHLVRRINYGLHTSNLILFLLSHRLCLKIRNPHTIKSRCSECVVVSWLLSIRMISDIKSMKCEETGEETSIR